MRLKKDTVPTLYMDGFGPNKRKIILKTIDIECWQTKI